jgi:hypothetical protein
MASNGRVQPSCIQLALSLVLIGDMPAAGVAAPGAVERALSPSTSSGESLVRLGDGSAVVKKERREVCH